MNLVGIHYNLVSIKNNIIEYKYITRYGKDKRRQKQKQ